MTEKTLLSRVREPYGKSAEGQQAKFIDEIIKQIADPSSLSDAKFVALVNYLRDVPEVRTRYIDDGKAKTRAIAECMPDWLVLAQCLLNAIISVALAIAR
jgi:hypothetical protein